MKIFLVGPMGAGKTTVGRALARKLNLAHFDSDAYLEERFEDSIAGLFSRFGVRWFRRQERLLLDEFVERKSGVFSLGGGSLQSQKRARWLARQGLMVYLRVSPKRAIQRLGRLGDRPLLSGVKNPLRFYQRLLEKRRSWYEHAGVILETDQKTPAQVLSELLKVVRTGDERRISKG